jgi:predicted ArsR family transcriptional regulator
MSTVTSGGAQHVALASRTRREILELVTSSECPLDAAAIAERMNLHVTTVRFHLDRLESAGLLSRTTEREGHRGRPRVVYSADIFPRDDDGANQQLVEVLAEALSHDADGGKARGVEAGRRWAHTLLANTPDDGTASPLMTVLSRIGFKPEVPQNPSDKTIRLHACPFRQAATDYPNVVCSVHRGLVDGSLEHCGGTVTDAVLKPFVGPQLCEVEVVTDENVPVGTMHGAVQG